MNDQTKLPFPDATLHTLTSCRKPESVILVSRGGGILIACDCIQNNLSLDACNFLGASPVRLLEGRRVSLACHITATVHVCV